MEISLKYSQWITLLSIICLSVRLSVCQAPPPSSQITSVPVGQCSQKCNPSWIKMLAAYKDLLVGRMDPICKFAKANKVVSKCTNLNKSCGPDVKNVTFCCCPMKNIPFVRDCLKGATAMCIPDNINPWQNGFKMAFFTG